MEHGFKEKIKAIKQSFSDMNIFAKIGLTIFVFFLVFIFGMGCESTQLVSKEKYTELESQYTDAKSKLDSYEAKIKTLEEKSAEYDTYKAKMQPYEGVQLADEQSRIEQERIAQEKQKQELEAKKAAEAKAAAEQKARQEEAERQAAAAKAAEEAKGYETGITYDNLARTPDQYKGKKVKFKGKVMQVIEGTSETQLRLGVNGSYDKVLYCHVPKSKTTSMRILEDDTITIFGVSNGLISYQSTLGGTITIPDIFVDDWGPN